MKFPTKTAGAVIAAMVAAAVVSNNAAAVPANGSFGFVPLGAVTLDTGDITALTSFKTYASAFVNVVADVFNGSPNNLNVAIGQTVGLSANAFQTPNGTNIDIFDFDISLGGFTYTFTTASLVLRAPTTASGTGALAVTYFGTITAAPTGIDTGLNVLLSQSCDQPRPGAMVNCSNSLATTAPDPRRLLIAVPEPASIAVLSAALAGFGLFRRRRGAA